MRLLGALVVGGLIISACGPGATPVPPTPAPTLEAPTAAPTAAAPTTAPTEAPTVAAATAAPTIAPTAAPTTVPFVGTTMAAPDCTYGGEIKSIQAVDASTVKFTLCTPDPAFLSKVAFASFEIESKAFLDANGGDSAKISAAPNGTGAYMVKEWVRGDHITLVANPNYWGVAPPAKTLIFRWSTDAAQRLLELQAGTVDGIDNPGPNDFATISADATLALYPRPALNVFYIGLNNAIKPFDNEKVRQALAMAIDKKHIVDNFYPAGSSVAEQFAPSTLLPGFSTTGDGAKWYTYDPVAAKKALADAGFPNGFTTDLSYRNVVRGYLPQPDKVAQEIQAELKQIGVKVNIKQVESGAFLAAVAAGKDGMFMLGWGADYPDSTDFYDFHFTGASKNFGAVYPDLVAEIQKAAQLADPAARQTHYDLVNALVKQHVPMIPVANGGSGAAFKASVKGVAIGPINENFQEMSTDSGQLVFMQNAEPISLYCNDETDGETIRVCQQIYDSLLGYKFGGTAPVPGLAEKWAPNADLTEWTFNLRPGVKFTDGTLLNANDVVATYSAEWDFKNPNHKGNTGVFEYFSGLFGKILNAPPPK
jgi:ABC-type transport system substrate-binding protein